MSNVERTLKWLAKNGMIAGAILLVLSIIGLVTTPARFFQAYLFAYVFWIGLPLGALGILLIQHVSGGAWGSVIRRYLEAATRTFPLMAVLFVPLLFGLSYLYPWTNDALVATNHALHHKAPYLNTTFFIIRAVIYFALWIGLSTILNRWSREEDRGWSKALSERFQRVSGAGLVMLVLTITFMSTDWVMSLNAEWYSTIFGLLTTIGYALSALALIIVVANRFVEDAPFAGVVRPSHFHDLGKFLLAFVMVWAYFTFSQYLIVWSGNLKEEAPYYWVRSAGGWGAIAIVLVIGHFALPFFLLLSRGLKRRSRTLSLVATGVFIMRFIDLYWTIGPEFQHDHFSPSWLDFTLPLGIGALWLAFFARELVKMPLLPLNDIHLLEERTEHAHVEAHAV